jgi:hypothetical protein
MVGTAGLEPGMLCCHCWTGQESRQKRAEVIVAHPFLCLSMQEHRWATNSTGSDNEGHESPSPAFRSRLPGQPRTRMLCLKDACCSPRGYDSSQNSHSRAAGGSKSIPPFMPIPLDLFHSPFR